MGGLYTWQRPCSRPCLRACSRVCPRVCFSLLVQGIVGPCLCNNLSFIVRAVAPNSRSLQSYIYNDLSKFDSSFDMTDDTKSNNIVLFQTKSRIESGIITYTFNDDIIQFIDPNCFHENTAKNVIANCIASTEPMSNWDVECRLKFSRNVFKRAKTLFIIAVLQENFYLLLNLVDIHGFNECHRSESLCPTDEVPEAQEPLDEGEASKAKNYIPFLPFQFDNPSWISFSMTAPNAPNFCAINGLRCGGTSRKANLMTIAVIQFYHSHSWKKFK